MVDTPTPQPDEEVFLKLLVGGNEDLPIGGEDLCDAAVLSSSGVRRLPWRRLSAEVVR
jgi:hypothetical protein